MLMRDLEVIMSNLLVNMKDQEFILLEQLKIASLFKTERFQQFSEDDVSSFLNEAEKMAVHSLLPTYKKGDEEGCILRDGNVIVPECFHSAFRTYIENGWLLANKSIEVGGLGMPQVLAKACMEICYAANFPLLMYTGLINGAGGIIETFGTENQKKRFMCSMYEGKWGGTMCITEPWAGSEVGAIRTVAKRLPDGRFLILGTKSFISCGDHDLVENIVHLVLARIEGDPPGTRGLSLFIVPKYVVDADGKSGEFNDVCIGNVEKKMGIRGSATCTLHFGDNGHCIGELLGAEREGIRVMFHMMNDSRLKVGVQSLAFASTAYEHAVQYAKERIQSPLAYEAKRTEANAVPIIQHPDVRRDLMIMKCYVEGLRALNYFTAYSMDRAAAYPGERVAWQGLLNLLTPVCKAYSSDVSMLVCSKAIDIYGGYGYCSEYPVEQYLRDCKIASLYEGTNGIQCIDLVGRKLGKYGEHLQNLFSLIQANILTAREIPELRSYADILGQAIDSFADLTKTITHWSRTEDLPLAVLHASPYLEIFGDVILGHFIMQAAEIAHRKLHLIYTRAGAAASVEKQRYLIQTNPKAAYYAGKIESVKFYAVEILATVSSKCGTMQRGEKIPLEIADESFTA
jgi:hypothetical protein